MKGSKRKQIVFLSAANRADSYPFMTIFHHRFVMFHAISIFHRLLSSIDLRLNDSINSISLKIISSISFVVIVNHGEI